MKKQTFAVALTALLIALTGVPSYGADPAAPLTVSLFNCTYARGGTRTVPTGSLVQVGVGRAAATYGLVRSAQRGTTMTLSIDGVAVPDTDQLWTEITQIPEGDPFAGAWSTKWLYAIPFPITRDVVVVWSESLDHQMVDLLTFDVDGEPVHTPAGPTGGGTCVLRPSS